MCVYVYVCRRARLCVYACVDGAHCKLAIRETNHLKIIINKKHTSSPIAFQVVVFAVLRFYPIVIGAWGAASTAAAAVADVVC